MPLIASFALLLVAIALSRNAFRSCVTSASFTVVVFLGLALWISYFMIDALTGNGIDASVLYHLSVGLDGAALSEFRDVGLVTLIALVMAAVLSVYIYRFVRTEDGSKTNLSRIVVLILVIYGSFHFNPAVGDIIGLVNVSRGGANSVTGKVPELFVSRKRVNFGRQRKNFVILYLESLEKTYLDENIFPGLAPNLQTLKDQAVSFTNIMQLDGTSWTISGMVASQCGVPLVGVGANNAMSGLDRFLPGATCLGDLLSREGYELHYMGGADLDFAGKGQFFRSHGFNKVEGLAEYMETLKDPEYLSDWGLYDDTLYETAEQRFDELASGSTPFGLVLLTVDTHHPRGYLSNVCDGEQYLDGSNEILNSVHCADSMAFDFIRHVTESPAFADTILVVMSDHLAMPNTAWDKLGMGERRNLMYVFGADISPADLDKPGSTLDLAPTLLTLIGAKTDALGYGRNLLAATPTLSGQDPPLEEIVSQNSGYLSGLWLFPQLRRGIRLELANERIKLGDRHVKLPGLFLLDDKLLVTEVRFEFYNDMELAKQVSNLPYDQRFVWVDKCEKSALFSMAPVSGGDGRCALFGAMGGESLETTFLTDDAMISFADLLERFNGLKATPERRNRRVTDIGRLRDFGTVDVVEYALSPPFVGDFAIKSSGFGNGPSYVINRELDRKTRLVRGLTLLGLDAAKTPVKLGHIDTCAYGGAVYDNTRLERDLRTVVDQSSGHYGAFAIVAHDSVLCYQVETDLAPLFRNTGLTRWDELGFEQPYVAIIAGNGDVVEYVGKPKTIVTVEAKDFVSPIQSGPVADSGRQRQLDELPRVAHAGGELQGEIYTNSVEALDKNSGHYRLFEIDLSWTSDGHLVCLHDWADGLTNPPYFNQPKVPSIQEFRDLQGANSTYKNCTLETLVDWLQRHPGKRVVLDVKNRELDAYRFISDAYPDLQNRFIPQIYEPNEYQEIRALGYEDIIWALYRYDGNDEDVLNEIGAFDLFGLSIERNKALGGLAAKARKKTGVLSWAHTVNSKDEFADLRAAGIEEIYTDFLTVD